MKGLFIGVISIYLSLSNAFSYEMEDDFKPSDLMVNLKLNVAPSHNNFTRFVSFKNIDGDWKRVAIAFSKKSFLEYEGNATAIGLSRLQSMSEPNNRSYWDKMYFENRGGSTSLDIDEISIEVEYDQTCCGREQVALIGSSSNQNLSSGFDLFYVNGFSGRRNYALDYLDMTYTEFMSKPSAFRFMIYDLGKSGASDSSDSHSSVNPKFGLTGDSLCSETVSWYYYEHNQTITHQFLPFIFYSFRDTDFHGEMHDQFLNAGRLYCYHSGREEFVKKNIDYSWNYNETYLPQAGDFLDRKDHDGLQNGDGGHAMMMAKWDQDTGVAITLDGPWNINFRSVDIKSVEVAGEYDYCVGRIPDND